MQRKNFLHAAMIGGTAFVSAMPQQPALAAPARSSPPSKMKITKIRYYSAPGYNKPLFNQARGIEEIETDAGIIGVGEGGAKDTIEQCAQMMIGVDPFRIEHLWQNLYRGMFYPPGGRNYTPWERLKWRCGTLRAKRLDSRL